MCSLRELLSDAGAILASWFVGGEYLGLPCKSTKALCWAAV